MFAQLLGLNAAGETIFFYRYPASAAGRSIAPSPFIWKIRSSRQWGLKCLTSLPGGSFRRGDNVLIGGFIVSGTEPKTIVLRALGPSLSGFGLSDVLTDPVLSVYDSSGNLVGTNDNWQSDVNHSVVEANGLAPANPLESAHCTDLGAGCLHCDSHRKGCHPGDWLGRGCTISRRYPTLSWGT